MNNGSTLAAIVRPLGFGYIIGKSGQRAWPFLGPMAVLLIAVRSFFKIFRLRFDPEPDVCPTSAIVPDDLAWPRIVRRAFSDPQVTHESTGVHGRGTEEVKTNDVTHRVGIGEVGYVVEFGRPTVGVRFRDIEKMPRGLAGIGIGFESKIHVMHVDLHRHTSKS